MSRRSALASAIESVFFGLAGSAFDDNDNGGDDDDKGGGSGAGAGVGGDESMGAMGGDGGGRGVCEGDDSGE